MEAVRQDRLRRERRRVPEPDQSIFSDQREQLAIWRKCGGYLAQGAGEICDPTVGGKVPNREGCINVTHGHQPFVIPRKCYATGPGLVGVKDLLEWRQLCI